MRFIRQRKNLRKEQLRSYRRDMDWKNRKPDPPSGDECASRM